jgi:transposase
VLLAAEGKQDKEVAVEWGITAHKVARWRNRFLECGLAGLEKDAPRPGRTPRITPAKVKKVIEKTTPEKPANATLWSTRSMAAAVGLSEATVRRIWHKRTEAALGGDLPRSPPIRSSQRNWKPLSGCI